MAELKTQRNNASPVAFISALEDEQKKKDSKVLLKLFTEVTGEKPKMWGQALLDMARITTSQKEAPKKGTGL